MKFYCFILLSLFSISNINAQKSNAEFLFKMDTFKFVYNLHEPDKVYKLPGKLNEISGLSFYKKNELAVVQDEKGNVYFFDVITGEINEKIDFSDNGDFEGIEVIDDQIWVLKSNGNLYRVNYLKNKNETNTKEYKTHLSKKNDAEGLAYDKNNNRLLIACKGQPYSDDKKGNNKKAIYFFDLDEKKLSKKPLILIDIEQIKKLKKYNKMAILGLDLLRWFSPAKGDLSFQPSGISIHPETNNIYVLASVGKLLIVFDKNGEFLSVIKLNSRIFEQPEGICFDPDGNLYISNEGKDSAATVLKFGQK
jgi:uncharacterized protein YjiK